MTSRGSSGPTAPGSDAAAARRPPVSLLFAITVTGILSNTLVAPAIPDILDDLGAGAGQAGLLVASASLPGIVLAPAVGFLADRFGRREVLVPCLVVFGLGGGLASFAPSFGVLLALRLLQGVGSAGLINLAVVLIGDHWDGVERARMIGRNAAVLTTALAVLPTTGGVLTEVFGWRASFVPYWLALLTAVAVARLVPAWTGRPAVGMRAQLAAAAPHLRGPVFRAVLVTGFVVFVLVFGVVLTALPVHLEEEFGAGAGVRGVMLGLPSLSSTIVALNLGRIRAGSRAGHVVAFSSLLFAAAFGIMAVAPVLVLLGVGSLLYGVAEGLAIPALQDEAAGLAPVSSRGIVVAAWVGAARAGQTVGPLAAGVAMDGVGARATIAGGGAAALALLAAQMLGRRAAGQDVAGPRRT